MQYISDREIDRMTGETGSRLAKEPKVTIVIAPAEGENMAWEGGLNGHFFRIRRGVPVAVPESLALLIRENEAVTELSRERVREYSRGRGKKLSS